MLCRVALVGTDVSDELSTSFIRVTRIGELVTAIVVPSSPILVTLMKEALSCSETSVLTRATLRNIPEDAIHPYIRCFHRAVNPLFKRIEKCYSPEILSNCVQSALTRAYGFYRLKWEIFCGVQYSLDTIAQRAHPPFRPLAAHKPDTLAAIHLGNLQLYSLALHLVSCEHTPPEIHIKRELVHRMPGPRFESGYSKCKACSPCILLAIFHVRSFWFFFVSFSSLLLFTNAVLCISLYSRLLSAQHRSTIYFMFNFYC
jgi:hypothetical protein